MDLPWGLEAKCLVTSTNILLTDAKYPSFIIKPASLPCLSFHQIRPIPTLHFLALLKMLYINKVCTTRPSSPLCFSHTDTHEASPESGARVRAVRRTRALQSLGEGTSTARPHQSCVISFCLDPLTGNLPLNMCQGPGGPAALL